MLATTEGKQQYFAIDRWQGQQWTQIFPVVEKKILSHY